MAYPGGKGACYQQIINQMPPHDVYIETHLGSGAVMRAKRPARLNIGVEINPILCHVTAGEIAPGSTVISNGNAPQLAPSQMASLANTSKNGGGGPAYCFLAMDAVAFLLAYPFRGSEFVYLDPPYLMSTRKTQRAIYAYEYNDLDHIELLDVIKALPCMVAISGYQSDLYRRTLAGWRVVTFTAQTRSGEPATETLWMNYQDPARLHDYQYLGDDYRERERIKRKKNRWVGRLRRMDQLERRAILWAIQEAGLEHRQ